MTMIADLILTRLDHYWIDTIGHVAAASTSKQVWLDLPIDEHELGGRFGWCWPALNPERDSNPEFQFLVGYCPEILAEITAHLDPEDRAEYLNAVEYVCAAYLEDLVDGTPDPDALRDRLERDFPYTGKLMADVEARAIRLGIVPDDDGNISTDLVCTGPLPGDDGTQTTCGYVSPAGTHTCPLCGTSL